MENASKALIIAGAILLSILIIGLGMYIYQQANSATQGTNLDPTKAQAYNGEFLQYEGVRTGTDVKALVSAVANHNRVNADDASRQILIAKVENVHGVVVDPEWTSDEIADNNPTPSDFKSGLTYKVSFSYNTSGYITVVHIVQQGNNDGPDR